MAVDAGDVTDDVRVTRLASKVLAILSRSPCGLLFSELHSFSVFFNVRDHGMLQEAIDQLLLSGSITDSNGTYKVARLGQVSRRMGECVGVRMKDRRAIDHLRTARRVVETTPDSDEKTVNLRHLGPDQMPHLPDADHNNLQITFSCEGRPTRGFLTTVDLLERILEFAEDKDRLKLLEMLLETTETSGLVHNF